MTLQFWSSGECGAIPSLLLSPLWPTLVVPDRIPSMGQIELFEHLAVSKQILDGKLKC